MSVAGLERMTTGSVAKRLTLSRHTGRLNTSSDCISQVGFDASDGVNYYNVEGSRTSEIVNIQGTFSFRIDGSTVSDNGCASNGMAPT